jgi:transposase
MNRVKYAVSL